ncbi:MAG: LuxR C-terminal-related transcriptional regulator [Thermomicrobiales bacterium]
MATLSSVRAPATLPLPLTSLVAREQEVAQVGALVRKSDVRLLTLTGPGGVGKTRVAIEVATHVRGDFPDGLAFVNLAPISSPTLILDTIAAALGLRDMGTEPLQDRLLDALRGRRMLLILDNFESVISAGPRLLDLLGACPGISFLITSRVRLRLTGEREFPIAPLPLSTSTSASGTGMPGAMQLFLERTQAVKPDFHFTDDMLPTVTAIVSRVDGLPLAIELAAARVKVLPPADLLQRMDKRLPILSGGPRDLPLRQQTMRDTIGWSYDLLNDAEQALFRRLAVFVGGFTLDAAEAINLAGQGPDDMPETYFSYDTLDGVSSLIDHSLLQQRATPDQQPRYVMLETIREYARDRLDAAGEGDAIDHRHAELLLSFAEATSKDPSPSPTSPSTAGSVWMMRQRLTGVRQTSWLNRLESDHDNLRAALNWLARRDEPETFLRLARALSLFWLFRGPYEEGRMWLEYALARDDERSPLLRRDALHGLGLLAVNQGAAGRAESCFSESLAIAQAHDDSAGIAFGWLSLGLVAMQQGQFAQATTHLESALAGARSLDDGALGSFCAGLALSYLGAMAYAQRALPLAASHFAAALREQRAVDDRWGMGSSLVRWGYVASDQGDVTQAATLFAEGLALFAELGDRRIIALALDGIAGLAVTREQAALAARLFGAAAALRDASGVPVDPACRAALERDTTAARVTLGEADFADTRAQGALLSLSDAVTEATTLLAAASAPAAAAVAPPARPENLSGLTPREFEILQLLAQGLSDREIAAVLFLSPRTVGWHVTHLLAKLDVQTRTAAATEGIRRGLA